MLVDCLGTWLTAIMDGEALWSAATADVYAVLEARLDGLCAALTGLPTAIVVTNEVGLGVVPSHSSGVLFRDLLAQSTDAWQPSAMRYIWSSPDVCSSCEVRGVS